jgi:hypothetical protein
MKLEALMKNFRHSYLPTRNPGDARNHETNLLLTKATSAESDDVTRNTYSGFVALRKDPIIVLAVKVSCEVWSHAMG